jgi:hypothetical protein
MIRGITDWKGLGRKRSWSNVGTIPVFAWVDWGKPWKSSVRAANVPTSPEYKCQTLASRSICPVTASCKLLTCMVYSATPKMEAILSLPYSRRTESGAHPVSYTLDSRGCFPESRGAENEADHLHLVSKLGMVEIYFHSPHTYSWRGA